MDVAIPIFDGLTALDAIGPYEVLSRLPGARVHFLAVEAGPKRTDSARDRVRPGPAVRQRIGREGLARGHGAGAEAIVTATGA